MTIHRGIRTKRYSEVSVHVDFAGTTDSVVGVNTERLFEKVIESVMERR